MKQHFPNDQYKIRLEEKINLKCKIEKLILIAWYKEQGSSLTEFQIPLADSTLSPLRNGHLLSFVVVSKNNHNSPKRLLKYSSLFQPHIYMRLDFLDILHNIPSQIECRNIWESSCFVLRYWRDFKKLKMSLILLNVFGFENRVTWHWNIFLTLTCCGFIIVIEQYINKQFFKKIINNMVDINRYNSYKYNFFGIVNKF